MAAGVGLPSHRGAHTIRRMERRGYTPAERRELERAIERGGPVPCPVCGTLTARSEVPTPRELPYVRRRVWILCPTCKRTAAIDVRKGGPP